MCQDLSAQYMQYALGDVSGFVCISVFFFAQKKPFALWKSKLAECKQKPCYVQKHH